MMKIEESKDVEEMGITIEKCSKCNKEVNGEELQEYGGYCKECYFEKNNNDIGKSEKNSVAIIIKNIAIINAIISILVGLLVMKDMEVMCIIVIIAGIIGSIFIYAIGEIIDLLHKIVENTNVIK